MCNKETQEKEDMAQAVGKAWFSAARPVFESLLLLFLFSACVVCSSKQAKRASEEQ
jgi:hypothetical protein